MTGRTDLQEENEELIGLLDEAIGLLDEAIRQMENMYAGRPIDFGGSRIDGWFVRSKKWLRCLSCGTPIVHHEGSRCPPRKVRTGGEKP